MLQTQSPDPDQALQWFSMLSVAERARFLASLAHNLTIAGRCFFDACAPESSDASRARQINELLHRVTGYLCELHAGKEDIAAAASVSKRLLEQPDPEVRLQVQQAWRYATASVGPSPESLANVI